MRELLACGGAWLQLSYGLSSDSRCSSAHEGLMTVMAERMPVAKPVARDLFAGDQQPPVSDVDSLLGLQDPPNADAVALTHGG